MRQSLLLLISVFVLSLTSCRNDFEFEPSTGNLGFSRDTVYLDTVFTNIGSSTYTLKVYNRSDKDIKIPSIRLGQGETSKYRMMIDGDAAGSGSIPGKVFSNVELLAKDSMFIFIETTIDYNEFANDATNFLYTDRIEFDNGTNYQKVELVTLVQDAIFLYPARNDEGIVESIPLDEGNEEVRINGFHLDPEENGNELHWTNEKPYVIYGYATVPTGQVLTVDPGARVHFHADSGLMVRPGASLKICNETDAALPENLVVFEGDRLEPGFADVPGQWGTVWLRDGSTAHNLNNLIIKNAVVGILSEGNDGTGETLKLRNVQIYNSANVGLLSRNGHITGDNVVINNAGQASLACTLGGIYRFRHCTFANYFNSYNQVPVLINDYQETEAGREPENLDAVFENCILYGSGNYGMLMESASVGTTLFNYTFRNCLIKFSDFSNQFINEPLYNFNNGNYPGSIIAQNTTDNNPQFEDPQNNKLNINNESAANGTADFTVSQLIPFDIVNTVRTNPSDIGAYESAAFAEED